MVNGVVFVTEFTVYIQVPYLIGRTFFLVTLALLSVTAYHRLRAPLTQFQRRDERCHPARYGLLQ
jgi:hypothetical protein